MRPTVPRRTVLGLAFAGMTLAACGRRGPLEAPPGGSELPDDEKPGTAEAPGTAPVRAGRGRPVNVQVPREKFILDPLL